MKQEWIRETEAFLKQKFDHATDFEQEDIAYRLEHTYRVANIGREIARKEGFDETEMVIACLLHDISYCEAEGENRFWPKWKDHGRRSAQIARPFLEKLGMSEDRINDICYGIAIHVDDEADFSGERTPFALSIGDADNIDRFNAYRIHEALSRDAFLEKGLDEKCEYVEKRLSRLRQLAEMPVGTETAGAMWKERIAFYEMFYGRLAKQLACSRGVMEDRDMKQIFESENIRYVEVSELLVEDYLSMINDYENVGRFIGRRSEPVTREKEISWVHEKLEEQGPLFSMIEKKSGEFIGNIELMDVKDSIGELGIAITAAKQDRGYGSEAITALVDYGWNQLGLKRIFLKVYPDNAKAIHVYEKCGFREYDRTENDIFMEKMHA